MSKLLRLVLVLGLSGLTVALTAPAASARPVPSRYDPATGYDVSYPQCGSRLPTGQAFGIVGVNGGLATTANDCLSAQLRWAWQSTGAVAAQLPAQLYLNTANPGQIKDQVSTWPTTGTSPYGGCDGANDAACSWVYGWQRAENSVANIFAGAAAAADVPTSVAAYTWWLDVETQNTWQSGSAAALANNRATLEGMTAYLQITGGASGIGIYSNGPQWQQIVGTVPADSPLVGLDSWLAGATSQNAARNNCSRPPLVPGGAVTLAQYVSGGLDRDISCS